MSGLTGNLKLAFEYVDANEGKVFVYDKDGSRWCFCGILICQDDLYYEMIKIENTERRLLSFVGVPESFGFEMESA